MPSTVQDIKFDSSTISNGALIGVARSSSLEIKNISCTKINIERGSIINLNIVPTMSISGLTAKLITGSTGVYLIDYITYQVPDKDSSVVISNVDFKHSSVSVFNLNSFLLSKHSPRIQFKLQNFEISHIEAPQTSPLISVGIINYENLIISLEQSTIY